MEVIQSIGTNQSIITMAIIGGLIFLAVLVFIIWVRFSDLKKIYKQKPIYIEITPPLEANKSPEATEQFFHNLHSVGATQRLRHRVLRRNTSFSLEVISSKHDGVRYVIRVSEKEVDSVERAIASFISNALIKRVEDPLLPRTGSTKVKEFRQTKHYAFPIRTSSNFEQHDPIAFIAGAMNKLQDGEQVALQLVLSPSRVRNMQTIVKRYHEYYKVSEATHNKAYSQLFKSELRVRVVANDSADLDEKMRGIESAIASLSIPKVQTLKARYNFPAAVRGRFREWAFSHRMPSIFHRNSSVFSSLELAGLYHFPAEGIGIESLSKSLARTLPPPLSLRRDTEFDVVIGETNHNNEGIKIGLTRQERLRHALYIGQTGSGKTTMLEGEALQDIHNGKGVVFIDPHGDSIEGMLGKIPANRIKDVVYLNPDDIDYPTGLNILELPAGVTGNELLRQKDLVAETTISVFRKLFSDGEAGGSRIESHLRNIIHTVLTLEEPTLLTMYKMVNNDKFRKKIVADLEDERLRDYWLNEIGEAGGMQRVKIMQGITTKLGRLLFSPAAARVLDHPKSTIDFQDILDSKKILLCNLSKGKLGDDTSQLFGVIILAKIQMAALARARQKKEARQDTYVYVDEFQNFATPSFVVLLAESRKYHLAMNLAQQTLSQQKDKDIINTIINNTGTKVVFHSEGLDDERYLARLFSPHITPHEIINLPSYNFYARLAGMESQEPVSGRTVLNDFKSDPAIEKKVIASSRKLYARKYVAETPQKPTGTSKTKKTPNDPTPPEEPTQGTPLISSDNH